MEKETTDRLLKESENDGIQKLVVGAYLTKDGGTLLLRRSKHEFMAGYFELPSGGVEEGESLDDALKREIEEETGLKNVIIKRFIGSFDYKSKSGRKTRQFNFEAIAEGEIVLSDEHDKSMIVSKENFKDKDLDDKLLELLELFFSAPIKE